MAAQDTPTDLFAHVFSSPQAAPGDATSQPAPPGVATPAPTSAPTPDPFLPGSAPNDPISQGGVTDPTSSLDAAMGGAVEGAFQAKDAAAALIGAPDQGGPPSDIRAAAKASTDAAVRQAPIVNGLARGISQFAVGFIGIGKVLKPLQWGGKLYDAARGASAGAIMFDPHEERLSNLVEQYPALSTPVTQFLAAKPDDTAAMGRFKAAVENLVLPGAVEGGIAVGRVAARASVNVLTYLTDAVRLRRAGNIAEANTSVAKADAVLAKTKGLDDNATATGDPAAVPPSGEQPVTPGAAPDGGGVLGNPPAGDAGGLGAGPGGGEGAGGNNGAAAGTPTGAADVGAGPVQSLGLGLAGASPGAAPRAARPVKPQVDYTPEQIKGLLDKAQRDTGAILDAGSYDAAAADGHAFAQTDLIPWQKFSTGSERVDAWMQRVVSEQEPFVQSKRGGGAAGVLEDKTVGRMINARVAAFGEDPALLRGMILQAGDKARTMAANMEASYVIAQKGMQDTYSLAMRINAGNLEGFESQAAAEGALKGRLQNTLEMYAAAKAMTAAAGRTMRRMRSEFAVSADRLQLLNIDTTDPHALTNLILSTQGSPRAVSSLAKPGLLGMATDALGTFQAANLLWGWSSQVINMGMNIVALYQRPLTQELGAWALRGVGAVRGDAALIANATAARNIARQQTVTTHTFLYDAWKAASWAFMHGDSGLAPHNANEFTGGNQGVLGVKSVADSTAAWRPVNGLDDVAYNAFTSAAWAARNPLDTGAAALTAPLRIMGAADEFTKTLRYRAVVAAKADQDAEAQGLKAGTQQYKAYVEQRVRDAFGPNMEALDTAALQEAKVTTFQQDLLGNGTEDTLGGWRSLGALVQQGVNAVPPLRLILPFVKTPTNLFRYGWRLTPGINLLQRQYLNALTGKAGTEAQAMATGEMMLGIMLASTAVGLRLSGRITGGGPTDYKSAKAWRDDGNMPYSVVGKNADGTNHYIQFSRLDPYQAPLALAADATDLIMQGHLSDEQENGLGMAVVLALSHQLKNKTYLQNITNLLDGITDDNKMQTLPQRLAPGFLPMSSLLKGATQMQDPILHEIHGVIDSLKAITPGFSDTVPPHRDWGGDIVKVPGKFLSAQTEQAPLAQALNDSYAVTGTYMQPPSPRMQDGTDLRDVTLEGGRNAYDWYQELAGNPSGRMPIKEVLNRLVQTDAYKTLPHGRVSEAGTKENMLGQTLQDYRSAGMDMLKGKSKLFLKLTQKRSMDLLGQLKTNVQDLRVAKARGETAAVNSLLKPFGMGLPAMPNTTVPQQ